jgi:DNA polymerase-3 subunit delta
MELTPERLIAQLDAEPLRPVYLIAGPEPLRVLEAADAVRARARDQGIAEREVFDVEGRDFDWNQITQSFGAMSLFASRRLIELRMPSAKPGKEGAEVLSDFCEQAPPDVILLITGDDWSRQHGGKWSEAIARVGHHAIAWALKPHELTDWVERRLRARGLRAERDAVERLVERVEGNLLAAAQEIDKLALLSDGQPIDLARMESYVADAARFDIFRLLDAALNGQGALALRMLHGLRAEGEAVPALMGMLVMELQRVAALARGAAGDRGRSGRSHRQGPAADRRGAGRRLAGAGASAAGDGRGPRHAAADPSLGRLSTACCCARSTAAPSIPCTTAIWRSHARPAMRWARRSG